MIAAVCWVPKGASKIVHDIPNLAENEEAEGASEISENEENDEEMADIGDLKEEVEEDDVARALAAVEALGKTKGSSSVDEVQIIANQLNDLMMDYDKEDDVPDCIGAGVGNLYYASNEMDPYLKEGDDVDEDEIDDVIIKTTDAVVVSACTTEDEYSYLEVAVYEDSEGGDPNMYTHQEKILSAYPLCTTWLDFKPKSGGDKGSFIAVGSMEPAIEIWDLNLVKEEQPIIVLGGKLKKLKEGKKASLKYKKGSHRNSVLSLAWNKEVRNVLASGSADNSVKVWNLENAKCVATAKHHTKEVQAIAWGLRSPELLLSGSFDQTVVMMDWRNGTNLSNSWSVSDVVESLAWDPHSEHSFLVSLKNGTVQGFDIRAVTSNSSSGSKPIFTLHAHDKAVTSISYNPSAPNLLATASTDKMVKLWDLTNNQPSCVASKNFECGRVFSIAFSEDNPSLLAVGGNKGGVTVWDILSEPGAAQSFHKNSKQKTTDKIRTT